MNDDKFNIENKQDKCCDKDCGCHSNNLDKNDNDDGDLLVWLVIIILFLLAAIILF